MTTDQKEATGRQKRQACWIARDKYFGCLDKHQIVSSRHPTIPQLRATFQPHQTPTQISNDAASLNDTESVLKSLPDECKALYQEFDKQCVDSWIKHFELLREKSAWMQVLEKQGGVKPLSQGRL